MAEKSGRNKSIDELRAEIAGSRERVGRDLRGLHHELDFPAKFRQIISGSNRFVDHSRNCGRCFDRFGTDAEGRKFMWMQKAAVNHRRSWSKLASPWLR